MVVMVYFAFFFFLFDVDVVETEQILLQLMLEELVEQQGLHPIVIVVVVLVRIECVEKVVVELQQRRERIEHGHGRRDGQGAEQGWIVRWSEVDFHVPHDR